MVAWLTVVAVSAPLTNGAAAQHGEATVAAEADVRTDQRIERRLREIFGQLDRLRTVTVSVQSGVVSLGGSTASSDDAERAAALAGRVEGVVAVENGIRRDASLARQLYPMVEQSRQLATDLISAAPLLVVAILVFALLLYLGIALARWGWLWQRAAPNRFIAELLQTTVRYAGLGLGIVAALSLLDATAFLSAVLGAAGVLGLAVGFAVRDTIENYICSILLSVRQPFRPNDHVVIGDREGRVVRLTSRATVLLTLNGNHLRIPNAVVFKSTILNYTRNRLRRFEFELGVDADDDPLLAIHTGVETLKTLDFVIADPDPLGFIKHVGDSNIVLSLSGWIDQNETSFHKARSVGLSAVKTALEDAGFALPEPIYRLRFDGMVPAAVAQPEAAPDRHGAPAAASASDRTRDRPIRHSIEPGMAAHGDTSPERDIARQVDAERRQGGEQDLLDAKAPEE